MTASEKIIIGLAIFALLFSFIAVVTPGRAGHIGPAGPVGPIGVTGLTGPRGVQGLTGPEGAGGAGPAGATGPAGPAGQVGPKGERGDPGISYVVTSIELSSFTVARKAAFTIYGSGFYVAGDVDVFILGASTSRTLLGSVSTGLRGNFQVSYIMPADAVLGLSAIEVYYGNMLISSTPVVVK